MKLEEIIRKVKVAHPEISENEFLEMIEERKKSLGNYFTDEAVAKILASELGVEIPKMIEGKFEISIRNIVSGLNDVTVSGRITSIYPVQTFKRGFEKRGKLARLVLADETGEINVVLWDDNASLIEQGVLKRGQRIRISHGYARESFRGGIELHVGENGEIEILEEGYLKIGELRAGDGPVNVIGRVASKKPLIRKVRTSRGEEVSLVSFEIEDETGRAWVSIWRELAEKILKESLENGMIIKLKDFYVKRGFNEGLEIFSRKGSSFEIIPAEKPS
ncbi:hypothetical protein DRO54_07835 [Candidatus Bathyarchaeota archaeon]|nr:MAG: hypothetical protein DRO54_07835 [Candidatus Bathyarchaeota archaeon]